ncbi:hypothetical protein ACFVT6_35370 [Streptomyces sp. NPDC058049]|uniref:hypothetical protein n=1 Tax=Streptomyces sp. NPDC058049 TaxID=3346314 RepID=UPI0036EA0B40
MGDNGATVLAALVGVVGTTSVALVGMWQAKSTADSAVQQARESAGGPVYGSASQRNAEFQNDRRKLYGAVLEALITYSHAEGEDRGQAEAKLLQAVRKAQIVAHDPLRKKLNSLANDPNAFAGNDGNDLAQAMNEDARKS